MAMSPMERLQILVRPDQAVALREAARRLDVPVAALIRDAIDQSLPPRSVAGRREAWNRLRSLPHVGSGPPPGELEAVLDDRVDKLITPGG